MRSNQLKSATPGTGGGQGSSSCKKTKVSPNSFFTDANLINLYIFSKSGIVLRVTWIRCYISLLAPIFHPYLYPWCFSHDFGVLPIKVQYVSLSLILGSAMWLAMANRMKQKCQHAGSMPPTKQTWRFHLPSWASTSSGKDTLWSEADERLVEQSWCPAPQ